MAHRPQRADGDYLTFAMSKAGATPFPHGVTLRDGGANVAVVSRHATRVLFCAFEGETETLRVPLPERLGDVHFGFIPGIAEGTHYGLRAEGPWEPDKGHRFDPSKLLLDPHAVELTAPFKHHPDLAVRDTQTSALVPKAVIRTLTDDAAPLGPHVPQFIYEIPVRAFTKLHPGISPEKRGTVAALAEPVVLEHLKRLGVDTVELMPVAAWIDERHLPPLGLSNAWGYNPVSFIAPDPRLAPGGLREIRRAVDALHAAGIHVILDVVFNHSGESDEFGSVVSMRGLDNALYYRHADGILVNDTGCGNTLALDERPVMQLAMDAMRSWVTRTGVDGFRFDLAPVMGRNASGFDPNAPLLAAIEQDPMLSRLNMIAEPWDVGPEGYRLGQFPARWQEWNDRYRDEVRRFWRCDDHTTGGLATRLAGSSDIFAPHRMPSCSINYLAAHDGFTLSDAVTYAVKDNHANGEGNRDGNGHEPAWPGGDVKALLATLFLSRGTPMLTAGDEFGRTQQGNNNAYAQDNDLTWLDWSKADDELIGFTSTLSRLRKTLAGFLCDRYLTGKMTEGERWPDAEWIGADGGPMAWDDAQAMVIGLVLSDGARRIAILFNRGSSAAAVALPRRSRGRWTRLFCSSTGDDMLPAASVSVFAEEQTATAGISDESLLDLATAAGIERDWWEVDGTHHDVGLDTIRVLLTALRLPHATEDDAREATQFVRKIGALNRKASGVSRCFVPQDIAGGHRVFGLASHLYALRHEGGHGIGDMETLQRFGALTAESGGRYAGINPLHHLFPTDRSRASPYQPSDRHYIDPIYVSIGRMLERFALPRTRKLASASRAAFASLEKLAHVDYPAVWAAKSKLLEAAYAEFGGDPAFDDFMAEGGGRLIAHGRFEALRAGESATPTRIAHRAFLQWIADLQLGEAARHGNLYRDLALGCAFDGGEIAFNPDIFAGGVSIGAPPDPFSSTGQVWNLPPFSPLALAEQNFKPLRDILVANMRHAAALRIDHVLGFARQFWVPQGAEGRFGAYVRFPLDAMIAVTAEESQRLQCLVVGEDLGTVPDGLRHALNEADILSYRVLWFERQGKGFVPPENYPAKALTCLASHDLPTFAGWRAGRDIEIASSIGQIKPEQVAGRMAERAEEVKLLDEVAGVAGAGEAEASAAVHGMVARAPSRIMLIQADDLAGERDPLNVPGTDREWPNWRRRVSVNVEQLTGSPLASGILARVTQERP